MNATVLSAITEPNRLRIVELLRENPYSVGEIAQRLTLRQPQVSKHLHVLHESGWVEMRPQAQQRIYQLQARPFGDIGVWLESFRKVWEANYSRLDGLLEELKAAENSPGGGPE